MDSSPLTALAAPYLHLLAATPSDTCDLVWSLQRMPGRQNVVRVLRGAEAHTEARLLDEFAAAMQFPYYFGENWDALDECLSDLEWLPGDAYLLFFTDCDRLLDHEPIEKLALLVDVLEKSGREWQGLEAHKHPQPPRPFHVVFQCPKREKRAFCERMRAIQRSLPELK